MAAKIGARAEYSTLINSANIAPRVSLAYRFPGGGQINMAYGIFYEFPTSAWLAADHYLDYSSASHYIINYQKKAGNRFFRMKKLTIKRTEDSSIHTLLTPITGTDMRGGVELFWRDKRTFKDLDYWITYTYLDTKRKWMNFPFAIAPSFSAPHTLSVVVKKYFQDINLSANMAYTLASGRPYYDIQQNTSGVPFFYTGYDACLPCDESEFCLPVFNISQMEE